MDIYGHTWTYPDIPAEDHTTRGTIILHETAQLTVKYGRTTY